MGKKDKSGIGLLGFLFLIFVTLKLTHVIDWPWWWVTAPIWGQFVLGLVLFIIGAAVGLMNDDY